MDGFRRSRQEKAPSAAKPAGKPPSAAHLGAFLPQARHMGRYRAAICRWGPSAAVPIRKSPSAASPAGFLPRFRRVGARRRRLTTPARACSLVGDCTARPGVESRRAGSMRTRVRKRRSVPRSGTRGAILASLRCTRGDPCRSLTRNGARAPGKPLQTAPSRAFPQVAETCAIGSGCTRGDPCHPLAQIRARAPDINWFLEADVAMAITGADRSSDSRQSRLCEMKDDLA